MSSTVILPTVKSPAPAGGMLVTKEAPPLNEANLRTLVAMVWITFFILMVGVALAIYVLVTYWNYRTDQESKDSPPPSTSWQLYPTLAIIFLAGGTVFFLSTAFLAAMKKRYIATTSGYGATSVAPITPGSTVVNVPAPVVPPTPITPPTQYSVPTTPSMFTTTSSFNPQSRTPYKL